MITTVNCDLSLQSTHQLVNLSTRQLQIMITDVNCGLSLQLTCLLVNLSTRQLQIKHYELRELHESLSLIRDIRVIRSF